MNINKILFVSIANARNGNVGIDRLTYYLRNKDKSLKIDIEYLDNSDLKVFEKILPNDYDLYGFYFDRINYQMVLKLTKQIKRENKVIVLGGMFPSLHYKQLFEYTNDFDYIICGDGEEPTSFLIDKLRIESHREIDEYPYIASRNTYGTKKSLYKNKAIDLNTVNDYYDNNIDIMGYEYSIMTKSNACTHHCTFCLSHKTNHFQYVDIKNLIDCIEDKLQTTHINHILFSDCDFFDGNTPEEGLQRVEDICEAIVKKNMCNVSFNCFARVDAACFQPQNEYILEKMRDARFAFIFLGVEAGNDLDLKLYGKNANVFQNIAAVKILQKYGLYPYIGFIPINPYSSISRLSDNLDFLRVIECVQISNYVRGQLAIEHNSPIYSMVNKDGLLKKSYNLLNVYDYNYLNEEIGYINDFLLDSFSNSENLSAGFDPVHYMYVFYHKNKTQYPQLEIHHESISTIKNNFINIFCSYLEPLYKKGDIQFCRNHYTGVRNQLLATQKECDFVCQKIFKDLVKLKKH